MNLLNWLRHPLAIACCALGLLGILGLLPSTGEMGSGLSLLRLALAMVGILALVQAALPMLKRMPAGRRGQSRRLRCEEMLALDNRHRLALVAVDGRELLLSLQTDGTALICELGEERTELAGPAQSVLDPAESADFARQLARKRATRA